MIKTIMLFTLFLSQFTFAQTQTSNCNVPVCDVKITLEQLRSGSQNDRYQFPLKLRNDYKNNKDVAVLKNLKQTAIELKSLYKELNEEDYLIRETEYLENMATIGLIKYTKPFNANEMINNMKGIEAEATIFEILVYLVSELDKLEDVSQVQELIAFADYIQKWVIATQKEDYLAREANKIIVNGGSLISRLNPSHEGLFKIKAVCIPTPKSCNTQLLSKLTTLSIMDTLTSRGLVVTVTDEEYFVTPYYYSLAQLTNGAKNIQAVSEQQTPGSRISEISLSIDPATGRIEGLIKDFSFTGQIKITGTAVRRVSEFYTDAQGPSRKVETDQIVGKYQGTFGPFKSAELVVSQYSTGQLVAVLNLGQGQFVNFRTGSYNSSRGVLSLTSQGNAVSGDKKLVLGLRKNSSGHEVLAGFMFTSTPQVPTAIFKKVSQ